MCTNLSSQTLSYTMTLLNRNLHPALQRVFLGCQFLLFTIYTLSIIHLVYLPHFWGITFVPRCTREMWKWWIIPFFVFWRISLCDAQFFFKAFSEILYNNIIQHTRIELTVSCFHAELHYYSALKMKVSFSHCYGEVVLLS